jgi:lipid-A-disaccharide synthase
VAILHERGNRLHILLPTLPHLEPLIREATQIWAVQPEISTDLAQKHAMFAKADAALAASGTVTLELALSTVPTVAIYDFDFLARFVVHHFVKVWTASLPNFIADEPLVAEYYGDQLRAPMLARQLERLMSPSHARSAQREGFARMRQKMLTSKPAGEEAAAIVLRLIAEKT